MILITIGIGLSISEAYGHAMRYTNTNFIVSNEDCVMQDPDMPIEFILACGGELDIKKLASLLNNKTLLYEESDGIWVLNSSLSIAKGVTVKLTNDDMKWLKIIHDRDKINHIEVMGKLVIDGIKITSWDPITNNYHVLEDVRKARPHITIIGGLIEIRNSFIGYLGYDHARSQGLSIYDGSNHIIINSTITNNYFGLYTDNVDKMLIYGNRIYDNHVYGLDPHTYSGNINITNNYVYNNGKHGIICSRTCYNINIINNTVYNNKGHGIMLDRNVIDSLIINNTIINNDNGIKLFDSSSNNIINNRILNNKDGIRLDNNSHNVNIQNNQIESCVNGIYILNNSHDIFVTNNKIIDCERAVYIKDSYDIFLTNNSMTTLEYIKSYSSTIELSNNNYTCPCRFKLFDSSIKHIDDNIQNFSYNLKSSNIEVYDSSNYMYSNTLNIPVKIDNYTSLLIDIDANNLILNKEKMKIFSNNTVDIIYNKEDNTINIRPINGITEIIIENINNYQLTDYLYRDGNHIIIEKEAKIYLEPKTTIDESLGNLLALDPKYWILIILLSIGILSATLIIKKR